MGTQIATVTRSGTTDRPYITRTRTINLGAFATVGEAKHAARMAFGGRALRWTREDLPGAIEHYTGEDSRWSPDDIPSRLGAWWDSSQGVQPVEVGGLQKVVEWNSFDGSSTIEATQTVPANAPTLVAGGGPNGLDAVRFSDSSAEDLATNYTMPDEYTVSIVASYTPTGNPTEKLAAIGTVVRVNAGNWELQTDIATVVGPAAVPGQAVVLTVVADGTNAYLYVDGTLIGSAPYTPAAVSASFSDGATYFGGDLYSVVIADAVLPPTTRASLVGYQKRRYGVP